MCGNSDNGFEHNSSDVREFFLIKQSGPDVWRQCLFILMQHHAYAIQSRILWLCSGIKGIVHPKLSWSTHPHVVPNLYKFLSYVEHTRRYFKEFWRTKQLVPIEFHSREINTMDVNGDHQLFDYQHSSKYLQHNKKNSGLENVHF